MIVAHECYRIEDYDIHGKPVVVTEALLALENKNTRSTDKSPDGTCITHFKAPEMEKEFAVMLVVLRLLMRKLLPEGQRLCDEVGPFTASGEVFTDTQLQHLFEHVGWNLLGILKWGYNINRSLQVSNTCNGFQQAKDANSALMWSVHHQSRMSKDQMQSNYNQASHRVQNMDRNSDVSRCGSLKRGAEMRVLLARRMDKEQTPADYTAPNPSAFAPVEPARTAWPPPPVFAPVAASSSTPTAELLRLLAERGVVVSSTPGVATGGGVASPSVSPIPSAETTEPVVATGGGVASPSEEVVGNKRAAPESEGADTSSHPPNKKVCTAIHVSVFWSRSSRQATD